MLHKMIDPFWHIDELINKMLDENPTPEMLEILEEIRHYVLGLEEEIAGEDL